MAGISSKAAGKSENKYKFNGGNELLSGEFSDGGGLDVYDAIHRRYDQQLGRFNQIDALADVSLHQSPYNFASNNPIRINDPLGLADNMPVGKTKNGETIYGNDDPNALYGSVTVTSSKKHKSSVSSWGGFNWPTIRKDQGQWSDAMAGRMRDGQSLSQSGDPSWLAGQQKNHLRFAKNESEYRHMQSWAVGILATPVLATTLSGTALVASLRLKLGLNLSAVAVDATLQLAFKDRKDFNIVSGTLGPESSLAGTAFVTSFSGTTLNLSPNSIAGGQILNNPLSPANAQTLMISTLFGATGGFLGRSFKSDLPWGNYYGDFTGNFLGGIGGVGLDETLKKK